MFILERCKSMSIPDPGQLNSPEDGPLVDFDLLLLVPVGLCMHVALLMLYRPAAGFPLKTPLFGCINENVLRLVSWIIHSEIRDRSREALMFEHSETLSAGNVFWILRAWTRENAV